jgi:translation initiation factor 2B subunit (eIF-2B alpha/beta/delta family)
VPEPDCTHGSTDVARGFLDRLERFVATDVSASPAALQRALLGWLRAEQAGQPTMAIVHQLAGRALDVARTAAAPGGGIAELRTRIAESCAAERRDLETSLRDLARTSVRLLSRRDAWIATLSHSRAVIEALRLARIQGMRPRALVGEGRPLFEGRRTAAELAACGIPVWLVADSALPLLLSQAAQVWLGADAVTDRGVLNKIGSYAVALAAREHSVPVYVLAGRRKFVPAGTGALRILEMPPVEIWDDPPAGVEAHNVYFELVPLELLRGVAVEDGVLGAGEAAQLARERELPESLRGT